MKNQLLTTLFFCFCATASVKAQQKLKTNELKTEISFKDQSEKEESIKMQENRIAVNTTDPTYPKDLLEKEIKVLEATKKATILKSKK